MVEFNWTEEDLKRGTLFDPGWYLFEIKKSIEKEDSKKEAMLWVLDLTCIQAEGGDKKFEGSPIRHNFSEKAPGFLKNFLGALGVVMNAKGGNFRVEHGKFIGRKIYGMVVQSPYEGRMTSKIEDWKPFKG